MKMARNDKRGKRTAEDKGRRHDAEGADALGEAPVKAADDGKLSNKAHERELKKLHVELVKLQQWVVAKGLKVCILFEGRDGAGKGGTIEAITGRVSPRVFRVMALPAPTEREKSQMYMQRYVAHLPAAGEVVIMDRSWYNRAGVERVMGFCTPQEAMKFLQGVPLVERALVESGIILLKFWLEVSPEEQEHRLRDRIDEGRKVWKLSPDGRQVLRQVGRLHRSPRRHVRGHRFVLGTVVRGALRGQEARAPERHQPPAGARALQGPPGREGDAAQAQDRPLPEPGLSVPVRDGPILMARPHLRQAPGKALSSALSA